MKATDIIQRDHNILRKALVSLDRALLMQTPHWAIVAKNVANYLDIGLREDLNSEERWLFQPLAETGPDAAGVVAELTREHRDLEVRLAEFKALTRLPISQEVTPLIQEKGVALVRGDAMQIPLPEGSIDAATIGFGIRNVQQPDRAAQELVRVLRPGGRLAILEFGTPRLPGLRGAYLFYFRRILPLIGRLISRHNDAYSYLPASVAAFHDPHEFLALLRAAGFREARVVPLTLGIVYLFVAVK